MESQSQTFLKALKSARKLHCRTTIIAERLAMSASALKHDHDIIIIKNAESLKQAQSLFKNSMSVSDGQKIL